MKRHALATLVLCAALAGCSQQIIYNKLDESAANEMVAALRSAGIDAQKVQKDTAYAVTAPDGDFSRAVQTLQALGLPREEFDSLGKVFKREGFVSTPLEERARLVHALSQELSRTVSSIDGVLLARVTLVMPDKHPLSEKVTPASAAVLIKHRPGLDTAAVLPKVKALVVNSVEGLPYEGVTVVTFAADPQRFSLPAVATSGTPLDRVLTLTGVAGVLALAGGGMWWWRGRRRGALTAGSGSRGLFALRRHSPNNEGAA